LTKYGISYATEEEFEYRFQIYNQNDLEINRVNGENNSYTLAHNKFSTLTKSELRRYRGRKPTTAQGNASTVELDTSVMDDAVDWRAKGALNAIQDQGECGSCWAFSAIAAMESAHFIKKGELLKLSEQQLVDCSAAQGNEGCDGGLETWAFDYAEKSPIELEVNYDYTG